MMAGGGKLLPRNTNGSAVRRNLFVSLGRQLINAGTTYEIFRDFYGTFRDDHAIPPNSVPVSPSRQKLSRSV